MITLEVLGGLRVLLDGQELASLTAKPQRAALLVYLAIEGEASRERLCSILWADKDPTRARHALSQTLYELKRDLGSDWVATDGDRVRTTSDLEVDLQELEEAVDDGTPERIIAAFRGPLLDHVQIGGGVDFERWMEAKRAHVHRTVRDAYRALIDGEGSPEGREVFAREWIELDPLDDDAHHALIEALGASGNRAAALEHYQEYVELIESELDVGPLDHTKELVEQIRDGAFVLPVSSKPEPPAPETDGTAGAEPRHPAGFRQLGSGLELVRRLSSGVTGPVYLAREPALKRLVSVKVLDPGLARDPLGRARFEREAQTAGRIVHPNVLTVYRVGETREGSPFIVMPYIKGVTLADRLRARGTMSPREIGRILAETASALAAAHELGVIHRDVRPENILLDEETGRAYLTGFGIAALLESGDAEIVRLTRTGELLGNPAYISPEQRLGRALDGKSDVFSLGVIGWELLEGRAFGDTSQDRDRGDDTLAHLAELLRRATQETAAHRPTASDLSAELSRYRSEPQPRTDFFGALRDRRMFRFVAAYIATGLAAMSGIDQLVQQGLLGSITYRLALAFFVAGLNVTIILAWFHGEKGRQSVAGTELALLGSTLIAWLIVTVLMLR